MHDPDPDRYGQTRMTYDLRRLRLKGLIFRVPKSHRYFLTPLGRRVALFMSKSFTRLVRPVIHRVGPALPANTNDSLRRAWLNCEWEIDHAVAQARIAA